MTTPRTKEDVVRAAGRLFAERGFHGTSMRDLGSELGLLSSSLYSHISGKDQLLVEVISRGAGLFQALADEVGESEGTAAERLHHLVTGHLHILVEYLDEAATFLNEARFLPAPQHDAVVAMRDRYEATYRAVLEEGIADGTFRSDLEPHLTAIFILSVLNAFARWYRPQGALGSDEIIDRMYRFIEDGVQ